MNSGYRAAYTSSGASPPRARPAATAGAAGAAPSPSSDRYERGPTWSSGQARSPAAGRAEDALFDAVYCAVAQAKLDDLRAARSLYSGLQILDQLGRLLQVPPYILHESAYGVESREFAVAEIERRVAQGLPARFTYAGKYLLELGADGVRIVHDARVARPEGFAAGPPGRGALREARLVFGFEGCTSEATLAEALGGLRPAEAERELSRIFPELEPGDLALLFDTMLLQILDGDEPRDFADGAGAAGDARTDGRSPSPAPAPASRGAGGVEGDAHRTPSPEATDLKALASVLRGVRGALRAPGGGEGLVVDALSARPGDRLEAAQKLLGDPDRLATSLAADPGARKAWDDLQAVVRDLGQDPARKKLRLLIHPDKVLDPRAKERAQVLFQIVNQEFTEIFK